MVNIVAPGSPPGGTAECAVPKLLHYAAMNELLPIAACEGMAAECAPKGEKVDRRLSVSTPASKLFDSPVVVDACAARCEPILGFMLCGRSNAVQLQRAARSKPKLECAVCGAQVRAEKFARHAASCCPRVFAKAKLQAVDGNAQTLARAMVGAHKNELDEVVQLLRAGGHRPEIQITLGVTEEEARVVMRRASLACPLAQEDVPLDVISPDRKFLIMVDCAMSEIYNS